MYQRTIIYQPTNNQQLSLRQLLKKWLIPKKWQHLLRINQQVLINNEYHPFNTILQPNDKVTLQFDFPPRSEEQRYLPGTRTINVAYEDDDILIVNKPANIKTHPNKASENDSLFNDVQTYLQPGQPYMVHRIDKLTSGLVLIAKTPYLVPIFNRELTRKTLQRNYLAVVRLNQPLEASGTIDLPIGQDPTDKRKRKVTSDGLDALTDYKILRKNSQFALLKLKLHTGRTHQIRVHLAAKGWPIVNDELYNDAAPDGDMLLCGYQLSYQIPFSDDFRKVQIDPPAAMTRFIKNQQLKKVSDQ